jgi:hypothetical protein
VRRNVVAMTSRDRLGDTSALAAPESLALLREELQLLSAEWYRLAGDLRERSHACELSREQEIRLVGALHDVAAALARCARACREGEQTITPIMSRLRLEQLA